MAANPPLVSVLMTNYNNGCYILPAVNSVAAQTYPNIELIVIDDGSKDNSPSVIERLARIHDGRFVDFKTHFSSDNLGINAQLNKGIKYVKGPITMIFDSDDALSSRYVSKSVDVLMNQKERNPSIAGVYPNPILIDENGRIIRLGYSRTFDAGLLLGWYEGKEPMSYIPGCGPILTEALKDAFPLNPDIKKHTKYERWARVVMMGHDMFHIDEHLFFYRMTDNNVSGIGKKVGEAHKSGRLQDVDMLRVENYWGST